MVQGYFLIKKRTKSRLNKNFRVLRNLGAQLKNTRLNIFDRTCVYFILLCTNPFYSQPMTARAVSVGLDYTPEALHVLYV